MRESFRYLCTGCVGGVVSNLWVQIYTARGIKPICHNCAINNMKVNTQQPAVNQATLNNGVIK